MVKVIDITHEKIEALRKVDLEKKIADECFVGKEIYYIPDDNMPNFMNITNKEGRLAFKRIGDVKMDVYDESIFPQAMEFAKRYEEQFNIKEFTIETDYSGI